jgi:hypothetical protein
MTQPPGTGAWPPPSPWASPPSGAVPADPDPPPDPAPPSAAERGHEAAGHEAAGHEAAGHEAAGHQAAGHQAGPPSYEGSGYAMSPGQPGGEPAPWSGTPPFPALGPSVDERARAVGVPPMGVVVPPPPPGPGVRAPFAAPPTERNRKRMWIMLGVGAVLLVLCCGGGVFGFGAMVYSQAHALPVQARTVVTRYLDALRAGDYGGAYDQLCGQVRDRVTEESFAADQSRRPRMVAYTLDTAQITGSEVIVPARLETADGEVLRHEFGLVEDQRAGALRICHGE